MSGQKTDPTVNVTRTIWHIAFWALVMVMQLGPYADDAPTEATFGRVIAAVAILSFYLKAADDE